MNAKAREWATEIATKARTLAAAVADGMRLPSADRATLLQYIELQVGHGIAEFAKRVATQVRNETFDETPTNVDSNPLATARDAGYRAGHNDRARSIAKLLDEPVITERAK